jgi:hypothetical protein
MVDVSAVLLVLAIRCKVKSQEVVELVLAVGHAVTVAMEILVEVVMAQ